jgi:hypothetical protein
MAEKTVNYSDEAVARLQEVYDGGSSVEERDVQIAQLAEELGKSAPSIRAKLTHLGVYVPKNEVPAGKGGPTKAVIVTAIADALEVQEEVIESLEKANKQTLLRVLRALKS